MLFQLNIFYEKIIFLIFIGLITLYILKQQELNIQHYFNIIPIIIILALNRTLPSLSDMLENKFLFILPSFLAGFPIVIYVLKKINDNDTLILNEKNNDTQILKILEKNEKYVYYPLFFIMIFMVLFYGRGKFFTTLIITLFWMANNIFSIYYNNKIRNNLKI